jgi:hypothetical protein
MVKRKKYMKPFPVTSEEICREYHSLFESLREKVILANEDG